MTSEIKIFGQNLTLCEGQFKAILGSKSHFSGRKCLGIVWALFLALEAKLLGVFSARKVDKWPLKSKFQSKFSPSERVILGCFGVKKPLFWNFQKWYWSCSRSVWALLLALKGQVFGVFSARKVDKWPLKSKFQVKFWPSERVILGYCRVKKQVFWNFQKWYRNCSGSVWASLLALKCSLYVVFSAQMVDTWQPSSLLWGLAVALNNKARSAGWFQNFVTPTTCPKKFFIVWWVGGWVGGWGVFTSKIF